MAYTPLDALDELDAMEVARAARDRYSESESYQAWQIGRYQQWHDLYSPPNGDQWPSDAQFRPGKIHVTLNWVRPMIEVGARLESLLPRIAIPTVGMDDIERNRAEAAEQLIMTWLEASEWDTWLNTLSTVKRIYGKGVVKVYWDDDDKRPIVRVIENPAHLRIGWGASDFSTIDWALYEYALSPAQIKSRWPDLDIEVPRNPSQPIRIIRNTDHSDPLGQRIQPTSPGASSQPVPRVTSQYEQRQIPVWDYWYRHPDGGAVCNAIILADMVVEGPAKHPEMPDLPYIVVENMHEPSSPEGLSEVELVADIQIEHNRLIAHGLQHIADDTDPSWYYTGLDGASIPPGIVPKAGEIIDAGTGSINLIPKSVNVPPIVELDNLLWQDFHKRSGLPEILFGNTGSDISGRALAVQVESGINRLDPRRKLLYRGLKQLIRFMVYMGIQKNPKVPAGVDENGEPQTIGVEKFLKGMTRWNIVAPEITPRDSIENTQNVINKINARVSSIRSGMDEIGVDSPEAEVGLIKEEQRDVYLSPQQAQAIVSIFPMLQQMQAQQQAMQQQVNAASPPVPPAGMSAVAQSQVAQNGVQQQQASAQPGYMNDQNVPQPMTQAGSPPPGSGQQPTPGVPAVTSLVRGNKVLNQIAVTSGGKP